MLSLLEDQVLTLNIWNSSMRKICLFFHLFFFRLYLYQIESWIFSYTLGYNPKHLYFIVLALIFNQHFKQHSAD